MVRGLAHEIKNPLGGIKGSAQLLEKELPNSELKEYTDIIIEETDRLTALVDRMLGPRVIPAFRPINIHIQKNANSLNWKQTLAKILRDLI